MKTKPWLSPLISSVIQTLGLIIAWRKRRTNEDLDQTPCLMQWKTFQKIQTTLRHKLSLSYVNGTFIYLLKKSRSGHEVHWINKTRNNHLKRSYTTNPSFLLQIKANLTSIIIIQLWLKERNISKFCSSWGPQRSQKQQPLTMKLSVPPIFKKWHSTLTKTPKKTSKTQHFISTTLTHPQPQLKAQCFSTNFYSKTKGYVNKRLKCRSLTLYTRTLTESKVILSII